MKANYAAGHVCWDDHDVIGGKPTGLVRASFGYASTLADADAIGGCCMGAVPAVCAACAALLPCYTHL